jgi:hypothetical protein
MENYAISSLYFGMAGFCSFVAYDFYNNTNKTRTSGVSCIYLSLASFFTLNGLDIVLSK